MAQFTTGIIALWNGAIIDIPAGWILCDGGGGSPDLRDKFVPAAGGTYNPGDTGGAVNHDHNFTTDGHFHITKAGTLLGVDPPYDFTTDIKNETGTTNPHDHLPTYYALAYIMKI